jgi:hypothetical protein
VRNNGKGKGKGKPSKKGKNRNSNDPYWKIPDFGTALGDARIVLYTMTQLSEPTNIFRVKKPVQLQRSNLPGYVVHTLSIDKPNIVQMGKLNNSIDVRQKPTLNGTLNGTSLKYLNMV